MRTASSIDAVQAVGAVVPLHETRFVIAEMRPMSHCKTSASHVATARDKSDVAIEHWGY